MSFKGKVNGAFSGRSILDRALRRPEPMIGVDPEYAATFSKNGALPEYALVPRSHRYGGYDYGLKTFYRDGDYSLELRRDDGKPLAIISFNVLPGNIAVVRQIQGKRGAHELEALYWQRFLATYLMNEMKELGAQQFRIIAASSSLWYHESVDDNKALHQKRMRWNYDRTEKALGFALSDNGKYYYIDF